MEVILFRFCSICDGVELEQHRETKYMAWRENVSLFLESKNKIDKRWKNFVSIDWIGWRISAVVPIMAANESSYSLLELDSVKARLRGRVTQVHNRVELEYLVTILKYIYLIIFIYLYIYI